MSAQNGEHISQNRRHHRNEAHDAQHTTLENRYSRAFDSLKTLTQHPDRLAHLSIITSLLKVDNFSWSCIQHLRNNEATASDLRTSWPQLYQIPDDIMQQIYDIRLGEEWTTLKDFYFEAITTGCLSGKATSSCRASESSTGTPSTLSVDTSSTPSWASNNTSHAGTLPAIQGIGEAIFAGKDEAQNTLEAVTEQPPMLPPKVKTKQLHCPLPGCNRIYTRKGHFENHMGLAHGIFRTQTVHASPQRNGNSSMLHAMHSIVKPTDTHTETALPLSMVVVRPTSNSSFSEMHARKLSTTEPWTASVTNAHLVPHAANEQLGSLDFDMSMTDQDYDASPTGARTSGAVVENMAPYDPTTERYGKMFFDEHRAEDMSRSYSQT